MRRLAAAAAALACLLAGCGGDRADSPRAVLAAAAENLAEVRAATLDFRLSAGNAGTERLGFRLRGPFAIEEGRPLPVARLEYERTAGPGRARAVFLSTGTEAFVEHDGTAYRVPVAAGNAEGLGTLHVDRWVTSPEVADGPETDGVATDRVTGALDVPAALADLTRLVPGGLIPVDGAEAERLRKVSGRSRAELLVGREDRQLRRLTLTIELDAADREVVPAALRELLPVTLTVELGLSDLGTRVTVTAPATHRPYSG